MRIQLVVNESASSVTPRARVVIQKALAADHELRVSDTSRRGHATRLAMAAAREDFDAVVVLGGDGTLNEAVNGLAGTETKLGVLPGGSTNVFARTIGMTNDPIEATGELMQAMAQDSLRTLGLGHVNGRYFVFHAGMGFDAAVVAEVEKRGALKRYAGHPLFVYAGLITWFRRYDRVHPALRVELDDGTVIDDAFMTVVLNTNPYTFLGNRRLNLAPEATFERGMAVVVIRTMKALPIARMLLSALGSGARLRRFKGIVHRADIDSLRIVGHRPFPYQLDGDYLGDVSTLEFRHDPRSLQVYVP